MSGKINPKEIIGATIVRKEFDEFPQEIDLVKLVLNDGRKVELFSPTGPMWLSMGLDVDDLVIDDIVGAKIDDIAIEADGPFDIINFVDLKLENGHVIELWGCEDDIKINHVPDFSEYPSDNPPTAQELSKIWEAKRQTNKC